MKVNHKRVYRIMKENDLLVKRNTRLRAVRTYRSKPKPTVPNQWWGIDMTKMMVDDGGWVYIVVVIDWFTKKIVGHTIEQQSRTHEWLQALDRALNRQFADGVRGQNLSLMSDNGCQPTSGSFMIACKKLGIKQAFTSYGNPKGNADTERVIRTMKEECLWLREWDNVFELTDALDEWINYYNKNYLHSALGYMPPCRFEQQSNDDHETHLAAA